MRADIAVAMKTHYCLRCSFYWAKTSQMRAIKTKEESILNFVACRIT